MTKLTDQPTLTQIRLHALITASLYKREDREALNTVLSFIFPEKSEEEVELVIKNIGKLNEDGFEKLLNNNAFQWN